MTSASHSTHGKTGVLGRLSRRLATGLILALAVGVTPALAGAVAEGGGIRSFTAELEARTVADPTITACRAIGPDAVKVEARYQGTFTIPADERRLQAAVSLEIMFDRATGVGSAEGRWQLTNDAAERVGRGELVGVVGATTPPDPDADPLAAGLALQGFVIGAIEPPDPDLPAQTLIGDITATLGDGATFPHLKGVVGDPTATADPPSERELVPAVLVAAEGC